MVRRFGFRWLLPLVLMAVHITVLIVARPHAQNTFIRADVEYRSVAFQEDGGLEWHPMEPRRLSVPEKVAILLNLPALLVAIPIAVYAFKGTDLALVYAATPFVPLLWYCIGRWLDVHFGSLAITPGHTRATFLRAVTVVFGCLFLLFGIFALFRTTHARTADSALMGIAFVLWGALLILLRPHVRTLGRAQ
jgi:hypothetical protein